MSAQQLQSRDYGELLNIIDLLRSQGLSRYIALPQIIVCGDQSSGKSATLEAVSAVKFPVDDEVCTRFATEIILRRGPSKNALVSIVSGPKRSEDERASLEQFKISMASIDDLPAVIEKAKGVMGVRDGVKPFSDDVLKVEISGPEQPNLTLVDLPGVVHSATRNQSDTDVTLVQDLVRSYMMNRRSIILAVVSAKNDFANQIITTFARNVDPKGSRTLGIITKPDTLTVDSRGERFFINLAKNEDVNFKLGWHVLKNRDFENRHCSTEQRDTDEESFFRNSNWAALPSNVLGVATLRSRLSTVLRDQILAEMPDLIQDINKGIEDCKHRLSQLGESRGTIQEQRRYLFRVSRSFSSLVRSAVDGVYDDEFFGDGMTNIGYKKRLRAVLQNILLNFAEEMSERGHEQMIVEDNDEIDENTMPNAITRSDYVEDVLKLMRRTRGRELAGTFNPLIVGDLFYKQSKPWMGVVKCYSQLILDAARTCLELILEHSADDSTKNGVLSKVLDPAMIQYTEQLNLKMAEIMRPHQRGHPITYNHYYTETIQRARQERVKKDQGSRLTEFFDLPVVSLPEDGKGIYVPSAQGFYTGDLLNALSEGNEDNMDLYACSEAVHCMEAYYKVALKVLVDNVAVLGIENCLMSTLADTFSPETVSGFEDDLIPKIAAETDDSAAERARFSEKLSILEKGKQTLSRLDRQNRIREAHSADNNREVATIETANESQTTLQVGGARLSSRSPSRSPAPEASPSRARASSSIESTTPAARLIRTSSSASVEASRAEASSDHTSSSSTTTTPSPGPTADSATAYDRDVSPSPASVRSSQPRRTHRSQPPPQFTFTANQAHPQPSSKRRPVIRLPATANQQQGRRSFGSSTVQESEEEL